MNYFVTADTHLGHDKVLDFEKDRKGFEQVIRNASFIPKKNILLHLGDFAFGDADYWVKLYRSAVACRIILVRGNHDKSYQWFYDRGIDFVCESFQIYRFGKSLNFTHRPVITNSELNIHGHMHRPMSHHDYSFYNENNILVPTIDDCRPISLERLIGDKKH